MKHITESKEAKEFLKRAGLKISKDSVHNFVVLENKKGEKLKLWAESELNVAAGIPGIFIEK